MQTITARRLRLVILASAFPLLALTIGCSSSGNSVSVAAEIEHGTDAAKRGYWQEAAFRFERAVASSPNDTKALNNLAVAYEALGRYEEAREAYEQALAAGGSGPVRDNHASFEEFEKSFLSEDEEGDDA